MGYCHVAMLTGNNVLISLCLIISAVDCGSAVLYHFYPFNLSWTDARLYCRNHHGRLASLANDTNLVTLRNISELKYQDAWIGNVIVYEPLNDTDIHNITENDLKSANYRCTSVDIKRLVTDGLQWNYTFNYIPMSCESKLPSVCLYSLGGIQHWMVQPINFSWWKVTKNTHCLDLWSHVVTKTLTPNALGTGFVTFNGSVFEVRRSYWIRKVLKVKQMEILNGDDSHILKCGYWDPDDQSTAFGNCNSRKGFICVQERSVPAKGVSASSSNHSSVYIGVSIAALVMVGCILGTFLFIRRRKSLNAQAVVRNKQTTKTKTRVWRKQTPDLSDLDPRATTHCQVIPPLQRKDVENEIKQCDLTYDLVKDDLYDTADESSSTNGIHSISYSKVLSLPNTGYLQMDNHISENLEAKNSESIHSHSNNRSVNLDNANCDSLTRNVYTSYRSDESLGSQHEYDSALVRQSSKRSINTINTYDRIEDSGKKFRFTEARSSLPNENSGYDFITDL